MARSYVEMRQQWSLIRCNESHSVKTQLIASQNKVIRFWQVPKNIDFSFLPEANPKIFGKEKAIPLLLKPKTNLTTRGEI